jgi:hypothetical protein
MNGPRQKSLPDTKYRRRLKKLIATSISVVRLGNLFSSSEDDHSCQGYAGKFDSVLRLGVGMQRFGAIRSMRDIAAECVWTQVGASLCRVRFGRVE